MLQLTRELRQFCYTVYDTTIDLYRIQIQGRI